MESTTSGVQNKYYSTRYHHILDMIREASLESNLKVSWTGVTLVIHMSKDDL